MWQSAISDLNDTGSSKAIDCEAMSEHPTDTWATESKLGKCEVEQANENKWEQKLMKQKAVEHGINLVDQE